MKYKKNSVKKNDDFEVVYILLLQSLQSKKKLKS